MEGEAEREAGRDKRNTLTPLFLNTLLSHHHYFPKALVEVSHVFKGTFKVLGID